MIHHVGCLIFLFLCCFILSISSLNFSILQACLPPFDKHLSQARHQTFSVKSFNLANTAVCFPPYLQTFGHLKNKIKTIFMEQAYVFSNSSLNVSYYTYTNGRSQRQWCLPEIPPHGQAEAERLLRVRCWLGYTGRSCLTNKEINK